MRNKEQGTRNEEQGTRNEEVVNLELRLCLFYSYFMHTYLDISIDRIYV